MAGFIHTINPDIGDRVEPLNGSSRLIFGESKIVEEILGLKFEISMTSFFQTNPRSAELLYSKVIDYVVSPGLNNDGFILDLFCGTGTNKPIDYEVLLKQLFSNELMREGVIKWMGKNRYENS